MVSSYLQLLLSSMPYILPKIIIVVASTYFYLKIKSRVAAVMATGSFMSLASIIYSQISFLFVSYDAILSTNNYKLISNISTIGYIIFAVGFALLIVDLVKKIEKTKHKDRQSGTSSIGISRYN